MYVNTFKNIIIFNLNFELVKHLKIRYLGHQKPSQMHVKILCFIYLLTQLKFNFNVQ